MDKLDFAILVELMRDSRTSLSRIAKKLQISREVASYRMNKLKRDGVILGFVTEIEFEKMGFVGAAVFMNVKAARHEEFRRFLDSCPFVSWVAELSGVWGYGFSIYGKTPSELDEKLLEIYALFNGDILDHRFTLHRKSSFYYEKYFGTLLTQEKPRKFVEHAIDAKDKLLLKELASNSRMSTVALAGKVGLTAPAVVQRIKRLERSGIIRKYSIFVDVSKLALFQYSVFVMSKNIGEKARLNDYLRVHPSVPYVAEYVGDPFIEFGVVVKDPYELRAKLQEIEEAFPEVRLMEVSLFHHEIASVGPPACVFE